MTRQQLQAHKNLCADVIGNDFDLTNNKFSYKPLKELETKVPEIFWRFAPGPSGDTNCTNCHKFHKARVACWENLGVNWCEFVNRADGISEIEGKAARAAASEQGRERVSNSCLHLLSL